jgi:hypothetical protein
MRVETWDTRFGISVRSVARDRSGRFVNNKSAKQLIRKQDRLTGKKFVEAK